MQLDFNIIIGFVIFQLLYMFFISSIVGNLSQLSLIASKIFNKQWKIVVHFESRINKSFLRIEMSFEVIKQFLSWTCVFFSKSFLGFCLRKQFFYLPINHVCVYSSFSLLSNPHGGEWFATATAGSVFLALSCQAFISKSFRELLDCDWAIAFVFNFRVTLLEKRSHI